MFKHLVIYSLVVLMIGCQYTNFKGDMPPQVMSYYESSAYAITIDDTLGGTAFFLEDGIFLTNCHLVEDKVLKDGNNLEINLSNYNDTIKLEVDSFACSPNEDIDLAVLFYSKGEATGAISLLVITEDTYAGKFVFSGGYGRGAGLGISQGYIQHNEIGPEKHLLALSTFTVPGDSGSPVVTFYNNKLYLQGVITSVYSMYVLVPGRYPGAAITGTFPLTHKSFAVPPKELNNFINDIHLYMNT